MKIDGKEEIAKTALGIISFEGIDKLTMQNLAENLGMNKSSIYHWFKSKEEILDYIFTAWHQKLMAKGFKIQITGDLETVLSLVSEKWQDIFSSDEILPYMRAILALRYSNERANEEANAISLMIKSQIGIILSAHTNAPDFATSLYSALLLDNLENILVGKEKDFIKDSKAFARLIQPQRQN